MRARTKIGKGQTTIPVPKRDRLSHDVSRKAQRRWRRENATWINAARSGIAELDVALWLLGTGDYDYGLTMARYARKDFRWARWYGFLRPGAAAMPG